MDPAASGRYRHGVLCVRNGIHAIYGYFYDRSANVFRIHFPAGVVSRFYDQIRLCRFNFITGISLFYIYFITDIDRCAGHSFGRCVFTDGSEVYPADAKAPLIRPDGGIAGACASHIGAKAHVLRSEYIVIANIDRGFGLCRRCRIRNQRVYNTHTGVVERCLEFRRVISTEGNLIPRFEHIGSAAGFIDNVNLGGAVIGCFGIRDGNRNSAHRDTGPLGAQICRVFGSNKDILT